jgi:hypothetical protein
MQSYEFHSLYSSLYIITKLESRRMGWKEEEEFIQGFSGGASRKEITNNNNNNNNNFVALVRERTIPTERPLLLGEVSANFCGERVVA